MWRPVRGPSHDSDRPSELLVRQGAGYRRARADDDPRPAAHRSQFGGVGGCERQGGSANARPRLCGDDPRHLLRPVRRRARLRRCSARRGGGARGRDHPELEPIEGSSSPSSITFASPNSRRPGSGCGQNVVTRIDHSGLRSARRARDPRMSAVVARAGLEPATPRSRWVPSRVFRRAPRTSNDLGLTRDSLRERILRCSLYSARLGTSGVSSSRYSLNKRARIKSRPLR